MLALSFTACNNDPEPEATQATEKPTWAPHDAPAADAIDFTKLESLEGVEESATETDYVKITVKGYGDIIVRLYPDVAPLTVENFKKLVRKGFYTDSSFHRIVEDFVIQGGASSKGKEAKAIKGEFAENGIDNPIKHERGVISMARTNVYDSASSQFFIVLKTSENNSYWLDDKYAAFGRVIEGMDVVDAIAAVKTYNDSPLQDVRIVDAYFR